MFSLLFSVQRLSLENKDWPIETVCSAIIVDVKVTQTSHHSDKMYNVTSHMWGL